MTLARFWELRLSRAASSGFRFKRRLPGRQIAIKTRRTRRVGRVAAVAPTSSAELQPIDTPEKAFAAWVKSTCGFTLRSARNYVAVFQQLDFYHDRIEAAAVPPTVLFAIAGAKEKDIENVLAAFENGEKPTVAKVRQMIGSVPPKKAEAGLTVGGLAGLRQAADLKLKTDIARFNELTTEVLARVEKALEPLEKAGQ